MPSLTMIIPNYNGEVILKQNLPIVLTEAQRYDAPVIVVDDKSKDNSVAMLKSNFPQVKLIEKDHNDGFSTTVNLGVKNAQTELVCLLNSDAIPQPNFLEPVFPYFNDPDVAAVGLQDTSDDNQTHGRGKFIFHQGFILRNRLAKTEKLSSSQIQTLESGITGWVSGGSGVFSKTIWDKLGGLEELPNPFYLEDMEYGYRAWECGYKMYFESSSLVDHHHNIGAIKSNYDQNRVKTISYRNQYLVTWKNLTSNKLLIQHFLNLPKFLLIALKNNDKPALDGFIQALSKLSKIIPKRQQAQLKSKLTDEQVFAKFT